MLSWLNLIGAGSQGGQGNRTERARAVSESGKTDYLLGIHK